MKKYFFIILLCSLVISCIEDLDQVNPNAMVKDQFWKTETDVLSALASTYKSFRAPYNGYWGYKGVQLINSRGDDFQLRLDDKNMYALSTFTNSVTTGTPSGIFSGCYTGIFKANQVIENIPNVTMADNLKSQYIAEAKFLRALNYFHLVINFKDVPIVTKVAKQQSDYPVKQSPEADVWALIESDLKDAKANLPVSYSSASLGRATQGAAIGFLGKAYVYQKKWAEAEAEFKLLATTDGMPVAPYNYDLMENFIDNFTATKDNNIEILFACINQQVGGTDSYSQDNANEAQGSVTAQALAPAEVGGWFQLHVTDKMFNEFQKEKTIDDQVDPRMWASVVWNDTSMFYQREFSTFSKVFNKLCKIKKYQNWTKINEEPKVTEIDEKELRYADILLMYAEAVTMLDRPAEAYPLVNRIRTRARLADLPAGYSQDQMMAEIQHQRMVEFFREGLRFFDLRRWGLLEQEIANSDKAGKENFNLAKHAYFPIPQSELDTNPLIEQSEPWQ
jgi:hypothetical protein